MNINLTGIEVCCLTLIRGNHLSPMVFSDDIAAYQWLANYVRQRWNDIVDPATEPLPEHYADIVFRYFYTFDDLHTDSYIRNTALIDQPLEQPQTT